ncbi:MAG TPA: cupin domain-containing protein [Pseudonocardiaceae bacterium]|nr:cupin domain-containing protein [Pseudonocardiaceae bacterium]
MVEPVFPGGTAVSGLSVYPWPAADGVCGGSPHVHLACTEGYVTVSGQGAVQTITAAGFRETRLSAGTVAWFSPGTIHRAVNHDGELRIVVVMQNSGLPEAGDAVFTFPPDVLADPAAYRRAADLTVPTESAARTRRDLAVAGFLALAKEIRRGNTEPLAEFYRAAVALKADRVDSWERIWRAGPVAAAERTGAHLAALREGRIDHLLDAGVRSAEAPGDRVFGMCGRLDTYPLRPTDQQDR